MLMLGVIGVLLGALMKGGRIGFDLTNQLLGSFVALSGDAHQAKVAQDIFRQEIRYERSLQVREDIRDVNKMMLESVQTHLSMGSMILGICFGFFIEGYPPDETNRTIQNLWLVFTVWSATFTLLSIWLALCFQSKISNSSRERLLRRNRYQMPDERTVGLLGGNNLLNQMASVHEAVQRMVQKQVGRNEEDTSIYKKSKAHRALLRVDVDDIYGRSMDAEPMHKGMHAWLSPLGDGCLPNRILDMPAYLLGETLVRNQWECRCNDQLVFRVYGDATLYVAAKPCQHQVSDAKNTIAGQVQPVWPEDELPYVTAGYHGSAKGPSGFGEFRRVDGFSIFVDTPNIELPLYKIVLETPVDEAMESPVTVCVQWNFKYGCEAVLAILRKGQVFCKEEDWPITEFNDEIHHIMPLRDYSGQFMRWGVTCLTFAALFTYAARNWMLSERIIWWFEIVLLILAFTPAFLAIAFVPIYVTGATITEHVSEIHYSQMERARSSLTLAEQQRSWDRLASPPSPTTGAGSPGHATETPSAEATYFAHMQGLCQCSPLKAHEPEKIVVEPPSPTSPMERGAGQHVRPRPSARSSVRSDNSSGSGSVRSQFDLQEATNNVYKKLPSYLKPIDPNKSMEEAASSKSLRSTLKRFTMWTAVLRNLFLASVFFAVASPHLWLEAVEAALVRGSGTGASAQAVESQPLDWQKWEVIWPPFFRPTAALLETRVTSADSSDGVVIWVAAGSTLRALRLLGGSWVSAGAFRPVGPALLLPGPARSIALRSGAGADASSSRRLAVVGDAGAFEVWLPMPHATASDDPLGIDTARQAQRSSASSRLPEELPVVTAAAAALEVGVTGAVAVAVAGNGTQGAGICLCAAAGPAAASIAADAANATQGADLFVMARLDAALSGSPSGSPGVLRGGSVATALHATQAGTAACGGAEEPVLWVAASNGEIAALGLASGRVLATFDAPLAGNGATVLALTGNSSHLVAVSGAAPGANNDGHGRRADIFSVPCPTLPRADVGLSEL